MTDEEWRPVVGYEGLYEVSSLGQVRSLDRWVSHWRGGRSRLPGSVMKPDLSNPRGYERYTLSRSGMTRRFSLHRLVCEAFHGPAPEGKPLACHWDGNPRNNRADNLYWGSQADNMQDKRRHGTNHEVNKTHCPQGHAYDFENTYQYGNKRMCKTCWRIRRRGNND